MRLSCVIAVVCAACQGGAQPAPVAPEVTDAAGADGAGADAATEQSGRTPRPLPPATHGRAIIGVAVSDDGAAALTIDSGNSVRLWPALDGTKEPVAVPLTAPVEMVLARSGEAFHIAALDAAGGLSIVRVDGNGHLVGKVALPFDWPYLQIAALGDGFVALRTDQIVERLDATGNVLGTVAPAAGERIAAVVARRGRALAMVARAEGVVARWLDVTAGLAWGPSSPPLAVEPVSAVLSPDHTRIAALEKRAKRAVIVELATGAVTPLRGKRTDLVPLNWLSPERVAFVHDEFELSRVEWFDAAGKRLAAIGDDFELEFLSVLQMEAADDRVVSFMGHQLVLVAPRKLRYLGYQTHAASRLRATPAGMVAWLGGATELLDDTLQIERRVPKRAREIVPIDDTLAVTLSGAAVHAGLSDDAIARPLRRAPGIEIALLDGQTRVQTLAMKVTDMRLRYEPASRLLATNGGMSVGFARFDPSTQRFGAPAIIIVGAHVREVHLLDPAAADGGIVLVDLTDGRVRTIYEDELTGGEPRAIAVLPGDVESVDRAGQTYVRVGAGTVAIHRGPREIGRLTGLEKMAVRPAPDGKRVAMFGRGRILMAAIGRSCGSCVCPQQPKDISDFDDGGCGSCVCPQQPKDISNLGGGSCGSCVCPQPPKDISNLDGGSCGSCVCPLWSSGFPGVKDVQWAGDELVVLASGIAKLDPATGATVAARCGWKFGLRSTASFMDLAGSTLCDRL